MFLAILPFGFSFTTDPPFLLSKNQVIPLKSSAPSPQVIDKVRSLKMEEDLAGVIRQEIIIELHKLLLIFITNVTPADVTKMG